MVDLIRVFLLEHACFRQNERTIDPEKLKNATKRLLVIVPELFVQEHETIVSPENVEQPPDLMRVKAAVDVGIHSVL